MKDSKSGKKSENTDDDGRYSWRKYCGAGYFYNVYPENYKTYDDYELALMREIHARGDEDKFTRKSGNPAGNTGSGQNTGFTRNTIPGQHTAGRTNSASARDKDLTSITAVSGAARFSEGPFEFAGIPEGLVLVGYHQQEETGELVIPGDAAGRKVVSIADSTFQGRTELESVRIPEGVRQIGMHAFQGCSGIKKLTLPTSLERIRISAFEECTGLTEVRFQQGLREINSYAFFGCESLKYVYIPDSVETIGFHNFLGKGVTIFCFPDSYAWRFAEKNRVNHTVPGGDVPEAAEGRKEEEAPAEKRAAAGRRIGMRFMRPVEGPFELEEMPDGLDLVVYHHQKGIRELLIPGSVGGEKVARLGGEVFQGETEFECVTIPEGVEKIGALAFYGCTGLKEVILPSSIRFIYGSAFENCPNLTQIRLPEGLRKIGNRVFAGCSGLKEVYIPDSADDLGSDIFGEEEAESDATIFCNPGSRAWEYAEENRILHEEPASGVSEMTESTEVKPEAEEEKETPAAKRGSAGRRTGTEFMRPVDGPFEFKKIEGGLDLAIYHHREGTKDLVIPGSADGKKVLSIGGLVFNGETELERITISEGIEEIGGMAFKGCRALKEVILPSSLQEIGANAFEGCRSLTEIRLPQGLREIDFCTFLWCTGLRKVYIPDSVNNIESNNFSGEYASRDVTIFCHAGSYAWGYAERNHIPHKEPEQE